MRWIIAILIAALAIGFAAWKLCFPSPPTSAAPSLLARWENDLYGLDPDEDVRLIPPPFSPQRAGRYSLPANLKKQGITWQQLMIRINGQRTLFSGASSGKGTVRSAISWCTYLSRPPDLELPRDLANLPADGDWIVREEASRERRMKAAESILSSVTGRKLSIERPLVERDVVIASGKWDWHPSADPNAARFYTSTRDLTRGGTGTLADSFSSLGTDLGLKVIDETEEPRPREVYWTGRGYPIPASSRADFLASLEKQTSLKFVQTKRVIPVWIVSERGQLQ